MSTMASKKVIEMIDRDGNVVKTYGSLSEAGLDNFMTKQSVHLRCVGHIKNPFRTYDFTFRYREN